MSFGAGWTADNGWIGDYGSVGDLANYANYGNAHSYPTSGQTPDSTIQRISGLTKLADSLDPVITTEIGWDRSLGYGQQTVAKYVLDAAMDGIKDGSAKTYFYALFDDGSGQFGLMNQNGTPMAAGTALHNLTTLLSDKGTNAATFTTGTLNYSLSHATANDNTLLLQKSDGSYWISIWDEVDPAHNVTVSLSGPAAEIKVFDPLTGTNATADLKSASSVTLRLTDHPLLIEVLPSHTTPPASPPPAPPSPAPSTNTIKIAPGDANPVVLDSNVTIIATSGDHMLFVGGTHDIASLTGGTEIVQAYQGHNSITTGAGNDTIRIAGSGNVIDAGSGSNRIEDSGSANTLVMPGKGRDDVYGYVLQLGDTIDFRSALKGTAWNGQQATLGNFLHLGMNGNDAIITVSATASGAAVGTMELHDSGPLSMAGLLAQSVI
jgi:serralysin